MAPQRGHSVAVGLAWLAPIAIFVVPSGALLIYAAGTHGWTWTSAVTLRLPARLARSHDTHGELTAQKPDRPPTRAPPA